MSTRAPMINRVSRKKTSETERKLRILRAIMRGTMHGAEAQIPKPVTLPYVSIQHVDMEKLP